MMLRTLLLFLLVPLVFAETIAPTIYEQRDFGILSKEEFTYSLSVDCTAATVRAYVMDESLKPVGGADTYLKYIDFAQPLISNVESDKDGFVLHKLPGNVRLMRGFFVLVIQKSDFRSKEIHFDINRCWSNATIPQPPAQPQKNESTPPQVTVPETNTTTPPGVTVTPNVTANASGEDNQTGEAENGETPEFCAGILGLLMIFKFFRGKTNS